MVLRPAIAIQDQVARRLNVGSFWKASGSLFSVRKMEDPEGGIKVGSRLLFVECMLLR
jgi:hypothetical protein